MRKTGEIIIFQLTGWSNGQVPNQYYMYIVMTLILTHP